MIKFLATVSLPAAWVLYAEAHVDTTTTGDGWLSIVEKFGLPAALVVFFVWQAYVDKARMANRITDLEGFIEKVIPEDIRAHTALIDSINKFSEVLETHSETANRVEKMMIAATEAMRPVPEDRRKQLDLLGEIRNLLKGKNE